MPKGVNKMKEGKLIEVFLKCIRCTDSFMVALIEIRKKIHEQILTIIEQIFVQ